MDGYEDDRFENPVSQNYHCAICLNVFKDPVMCQRNQHCFCRSCITRHLTNSQACPSCMEELTLETLTRPPRIFMSCFSELKIRCDYVSRGCQEFVQLGDLETHVKDCGFTPVLCSNEGCLVEINKRDRTHHEAEVCEFRKVKCHECSEIRKEMDEVKMFLSAVTDQVEEIKVNVMATTNKVEEVKVNVEEMKTNSNNEMKEILEIKKELTEIKTQLMTQPDQMRAGIQVAQEKIMKEIERIKTDAANVNESVVIAGGYTTRNLNTVEMFRWSERSWSPLQPMKESRHGATSIVYENRIIVTGGNGGRDMESMNINSLVGFGQWSNFPAKLPAKLFGHSSVVYNERLIVTGGLDGDQCKYSDSIHEILLNPPYTAKFLSRMPEPRIYHGVELFDDKLLVVGGRKAGSAKDSVASAVIYDINKNESKEMAPLPFAVCEMATVRWGDNVIVIGGVDKKDRALNTVVIYNVKTGKNYMLPEMKCKRKLCTAVVSQNTIVVMGGQDEKGKILNSVEGFSFGSYLWEDLPPMIEARERATAVAW